MLKRWSGLFLVVTLTVAQVTLAQVPGLNPGDLNNNLDNSRQNPRNQSATDVNISETQAIALARQRFTGNILRITLTGEGANRRYQIRMENEGKVFTVYVHATSGRVSGGQG
ncbi:MAG: PepSY domain-containing protein [Pseudohongiellaceae bacterium]